MRTRIQSAGRVRFLVCLVAACMLGVVLYWPSLHGPRLFDDEIMLSDAGRSETFADLIVSLNWLRPETRPLVRLTFGLETLLFGDSMVVHRLGNILIHVFAATALYALVRSVEQTPVPVGLNTTNADNKRIAFAVALLWFVHPLQTSAVAYVAQRGESLMGLFFFCYLRCLVKLITARNAKWLACVILAFCLGLFSKTVMITAPAVGLLLDRAFFSSSWKQVFRGQWKVLLLPIVGSSIAVVLLLPGILKGEANVGFGGDAPPIDLHLAAQAKVLWLYVSQSLWPQWLSVDHAMRPPQYVSDQLGWILLTGLLLVAIGTLYWLQKFAVGFLLLAPLIVLSVTSSFIPTADLWVDHRMYVPLACVLIILIIVIRSVITRLHGPEKTHRILLVLAGTVCLFFSCRTFQRSGDYSSRVHLWHSAVLENPDNDRAFQNLIDGIRKESAQTAILPVLNRAMEAATNCGIVPTVALGRLGEYYAEQGDSEKAINLLAQAIRLDDRHFFEGYRGTKRNAERFGMHVNMSLALAAQGQSASAVEQINQAFLYADSSPDARALAGSLSLQTGNIHAAEEHFLRAIELRPGWKEVETDLEQIRQME